ncbi:LLM class F420-dependent oxidoreductase [Pseudonocardia acaciae]|uniref:LLM class F420-dependent oxidoreductase n=1 Tax=Pseudonocardia acaciae TaxID=551276 RepID=UPI00048AE345|nr:LLM class F420-dependent oxidoreductase [Pseudonocardia acaciae]
MATLGTYGIWRVSNGLDGPLVAELEKLGYGAVWIGGSPPADLRLAEELLDATERIAVVTGIVNMWTSPAATVAESYHRLAAKHPGRFVLGVGVGHREATQEYRKPYDTIVEYLDALDAAEVPVGERILAALGPKVTRLAGERTAGAFPYLITPEHTAQARAILGDGPLLTPEHKVVLGTDPERTRPIAREAVLNPYLRYRLSNYLNNWRRLGFTEDDLAGEGSDRLIDALVAQGDAATVAARLREHLDAGADHVAIQLATEPGADPLPGYRELAEALALV